jgi:hypothetical protein
VNKKLRCRCDAAARWLARQARGNDRLNSHLLETPEASQRAKVLRCSQLPNVHIVDEDDVKDEQTVRKREIAEPPHDGSADSSDDSENENDFVKNDIEALLSCPHANPKFVSETQMPRVQISALALERPIAIAHRPIAAPDCIHLLLLQQHKRRKLKNPSMQSPGGKAISGEVIVGQGNPVFQGGNAKYPSNSAQK